MYLEEEAVRGTLQLVRSLSTPGALLAFDAWCPPDTGLQRIAHRDIPSLAMRLVYSEPFVWAPQQEALDPFLRDVPDFPKPGIMFKDISPLLASAEAMRYAIDQMAEKAAALNIRRVAGVESRGFLFGTPLALRLDVGFTPIRKPGKLPADATGIEYALDYGTDRLEIHNDGLNPGDRVLVVDDVLATGGTAQASCELVELIGDDEGIREDLPAWCEGNGHQLVSLDEDGEGRLVGRVRKSGEG